MADDREVELRLYIDPNVPEWVLIDSGRLRQILLNILSNALKFSASDLINRAAEVFFPPGVCEWYGFTCDHRR